MSLGSLPVAAPVDSPTQQHSSLLTDAVVLHSGNLSGVSQILGVSELGCPPPSSWSQAQGNPETHSADSGINQSIQLVYQAFHI